MALRPAATKLRGRLVRMGRWMGSRVGLRWRITIGFGVGALVLSLALAGIAYGLTRENLLDQREGSARALAVQNAGNVQRQLVVNEEPREAIRGLSRPSGSAPLLYTGEWFGGEAGIPSDALPADLVELVVEEREPARMRFAYQGTTYVTIGLPLDDVDAAYFEVIPLTDIEDALESLTFGLIAAAVVTTMAGGFFGWIGARRVFRPLDSIRVAARRLARGELATRVDAGADPDLAPLADSFNQMVDSLRDRIEQDARFASNVTHELRSPLTTLAASLAVLENTRDDLPERAQHAVDLLLADVDRFTQLIEDLLEISRLDAGVLNLESDLVLIAELVMYAVEDQSDRDIPVDVAGDLAGVVIQVDKRRLLRVIANLLDNAAKYAGGADRVELQRVGDMVQIAVEDRGPGVAAKDQYRIFDRFSRGRVEGERAGRKGVGLGLSIVAEHVRVQGGDVWVESRPDGEPGARFVFTLPVTDTDEIDDVDLSLPVPVEPSGDDGDDRGDGTGPVEGAVDETVKDRLGA